MAWPKYLRRTIILPIRVVIAPVKVFGATLRFVSHRIQQERPQVVESPRVIEELDYASPMPPEEASELGNAFQESKADIQDESFKSFEIIGGIDVPPTAGSSQNPPKSEPNMCKRSFTNLSARGVSQMSISLISHCVPPQERSSFSSVKKSTNFLRSRLKLKANADQPLPKESERNVTEIGLANNNKNSKKDGQQNSEENCRELKTEEAEKGRRRTRARRRRKKGNSRQETSKPDDGSSSHSPASDTVSTESPDADPTVPISVNWTAPDGTKRVAHSFDDVCAIFNPNHVPRNADGSIKPSAKPTPLKTISQGSSSNSNRPSLGNGLQEKGSTTQ